MPVWSLQTWSRQHEKCSPEGSRTLPQEHPVCTELLCQSGEGRGRLIIVCGAPDGAITKHFTDWFSSVLQTPVIKLFLFTRETFLSKHFVVQIEWFTFPQQDQSYHRTCCTPWEKHLLILQCDAAVVAIGWAGEVECASEDAHVQCSWYWWVDKLTVLARVWVKGEGDMQICIAWSYEQVYRWPFKAGPPWFEFLLIFGYFWLFCTMV